MRFFLLLTVLTVGLVTGTAEDARAYTAMGVGTGSCGNWTKDRSDPQAHFLANMDMSWVFGFLSGMGYVAERGDDPLQGMDAEGVSGWIDNYCRAHSIDKIRQAAAAFSEAHPH